MIQLYERIFYTDGSCWPNPGPGGWAVIEDMGAGEFRTAMSGRDLMTTNIRMEGMAIEEAMRLGAGQRILICTDSLHWVNILTQYAQRWESNGWNKPGGVKNLEQVKRAYYRYLKHQRVTFKHVRGHQGIPGNEAADVLAGAERDIASAERVAKVHS